jgi:uncharacterized protein YjbI with pentapeptide repeats
LIAAGEVREDDAMAREHDRTDAFRGARFTRSDLSGTTFRDCDLSGVRITTTAQRGS